MNVKARGMNRRNIAHFFREKDMHVRFFFSRVCSLFSSLLPNMAVLQTFMKRGIKSYI